jgi:TonB family protein
MREMINYIIEANIALLLFLAFYQFILKQETNFRFLRFYMLSAVIISLVFPLVHINNASETTIPSISNVVPEYWLPEIVIGADGLPSSGAETNTAYNAWQWAGWIYAIGVGIFLLWLIMQLGYVWIMLRNATAYTLERFRIIESAEDKPTFSFFNLIYIGRAHELTAMEKEQIIRHESVHARQLHSLDILLVTILGILFWFNPLIKLYKRIFIQLHEFEADARAVENSDVNQYCSLLARVALQTHFPIASHFNESLTVKRIEMMRTIKKKIKPWKVAIAAIAFTLCFVVIACQDQVLDEMSKSTISQTGDYPAEVKEQMKNYLKEHPGAKLTYMEGDPEEMNKFISSPQVSSRIVYNYDLKKDGVEKKGVLLSDVVQYAEALQTEEKIFMVVEQQPEFPGGYDAMKDFIKANMKYPEAAATAGKSGTVYVSMIINENGSVSDPKVLRGVSADMDAEAVRVVSMLPNWIPGEQNGKKVKVRFTLPIRFGITDHNHIDEVPNSNFAMKIEYTVVKTGNETLIRGKVLNKSENEKKMPGVNLHVAGTTMGTTTDADGNFILKIEKSSGQLVASHIGFETQRIDF